MKDEWYTPAWITDPLGDFDLDPAAPVGEHRTIAKKEYTKQDDGLKQDWHGRVWLNPPFSHPAMRLFVEKMSSHGNGIMLVLNRGFDSAWFQDYIFGKADAILFLRGRIKFIDPSGKEMGSSPIGCSLVAYGAENARILEYSRLKGKYIKLKTENV